VQHRVARRIFIGLGVVLSTFILVQVATSIYLRLSDEDVKREVAKIQF